MDAFAGTEHAKESAAEIAERWVDVEDAWDIVMLDKYIVLAAFIGTVLSVEIPQLKKVVTPKLLPRNQQREQTEGANSVTRPRGFRIP